MGVAGHVVGDGTDGQEATVTCKKCNNNMMLQTEKVPIPVSYYTCWCCGSRVYLNLAARGDTAEHICKTCGKPYPAIRSSSMYCSRKCNYNSAAKIAGEIARGRRRAI